MLVETVVLPSAATGSYGTTDAALALFMDLHSGGQLLVDSSGVGGTQLAAAISGWGDQSKRQRATKALLRLHAQGRIVPVPPGDPEAGCTEACNTLRSVAQRWAPGVVVCGAGCRAELPRQMVEIAGYMGSEAQDLLQRATVSLSRRRSIDEDLERLVWAPFVRFAESLVLIDRQIGRSIQEVVGRGGRARIGEGFDRTIRSLLDVYTRAGLRSRSIRLLTGLWADRPGAGDAFRELEAWTRSLSSEYPVVAISLDVREEERRAQLDHDRYLVSNQGALLVSRGFDLLFTDRQMSDAKLDPRHDARRVHSARLTLLPEATDVLLDAEDLPPFEA